MKNEFRHLFLALLVAFPLSATAFSQKPELARTPPMGWNSWNHFRINITDGIIRAQADALVKSGMKNVGYEYVVIDGGWEGFHDEQGNFHPDAQKFPDMKALVDYLHGLGLKAGIHTTPGPKTCAGREGSYGHEKQDAETFTKWGIDFVKYDWCTAGQVYQPDQMQAAYKKFADALAATGRPMLLSLCQYGMQDVWKWGASIGAQMWRTTNDIQDNYYQMMFIGLGQSGLEKYAGPGHWNDPDMLEVGNGNMKDDEYRTHMTLWSILAAPLFAGNDLTNMSPVTVEILTNPEVIAVDQDAAGVQGRRVWQEGPAEVWIKPLADGSKAVAAFNRETRPREVPLNFAELSLPAAIQARDLWAHKDLGNFQRTMTTTVPGHGSVLLKVKPAAKFGGSTLLEEINAAGVMSFFEKKRQAGLSPKSRLNLYVLFQKMLNLAQDLELIQANPMRRVPKPKVQRIEKPALTPAQVRSVIDASPENLRALFVLLYLTGMRIGEALGLKWQDVDFLKAKLYLRRSIWRRNEQTPKTEGSIRAKHLVPALAEALKRHREHSQYVENDCYVFTTGVGTALDPDDVRKRVLYPAMDRAEIQRAQARACGFHLFRHSAGSELTEATGNLKKTQSFLGHSSITTTGDVYAHLQPDAEIEAMQRLEEAIFPNGAQLCSNSSGAVN